MPLHNDVLNRPINVGDYVHYNAGVYRVTKLHKKRSQIYMNYLNPRWKLVRDKLKYANETCLIDEQAIAWYVLQNPA
jgi:hypothetical protein